MFYYITLETILFIHNSIQQPCTIPHPPTPTPRENWLFLFARLVNDRIPKNWRNPDSNASIPFISLYIHVCCIWRKPLAIINVYWQPVSHTVHQTGQSSSLSAATCQLTLGLLCSTRFYSIGVDPGFCFRWGGDWGRGGNCTGLTGELAFWCLNFRPG